MSFLEREPHYTNSRTVLTLLDDNGFHGFITATIVVNVFYHVEKYRGRDLAFACTENLLSNPDLAVFGIDKSILTAALKSGMTDFEDAVQAEAARLAGLDFIVTRNKRDFRSTLVPATSPEELLERLI